MYRGHRRRVRGQQGKAYLKALGGLLGAVFTVVLISTAFFRWHLTGPGPLLTPRFSLSEFIHDLPHHLPWLAAFIVLSGSMIPLRAVQWQRTLSKKVPFKERYHLVAIGAFTHNALPGKLGDVIRAFLLSRSESIPFVRSLGSVAVCKLLEFAALVMIAALSLLGPVGDVLSQFSVALRTAAIICVGLVLFVVLLAHFAAPIARALHRRHRLPKLQAFLHEVAEGLGTARSFKGMAIALAFSVPPVLANVLAYGAGLAGMGLEGGFYAGAVILGAIALGQSTPGLPVGMGVYYFVTSWMARKLGATAEQAAAYSTLTHLATLFTQIAIGAVSVYVRRIGWRELIRRTRRAREEVRHVTEEVEATA